MARSPIAQLLPLSLAFALAACSGRGAGSDSGAAGNNSAEAANSAAADFAFAEEAGADGKPGKAAKGGKAKAEAGKDGAAKGGPGQGETLGSETVKARFDGFLGGHQMDARLGGAGYRGPKRVAVQSAPVAAFLHAHKGETLTLRLERVRQPDPAEPESSPPVTLVRIASAQAGGADSDSYWRTLSKEDKACATRSLDGAGSPCNGEEAVRKQGERG